MHTDAPELGDLIAPIDPATLARAPVSRDKVIETLRAHGDEPGAAIVAALPAAGGVLEVEAVDDALLTAQRALKPLLDLATDHGRRIAEPLRPILQRQRERGGPLRVVEIGCGLGANLRALASHGLGSDVELIGVDLNPTLIEEARHLAQGLPVRLLQADAFNLDDPATVYLSVGLMHHFRGPWLTSMLQWSAKAETRAFLHLDLRPSPALSLAPWLLAAAGSPDPLAAHDSVLSALRAYPARTLRAAARAGAPGFQIGLRGEPGAPMWALIGERPA